MRLSGDGLGLRYFPAVLCGAAVTLLLPAVCEIAIGDTVPAFTCDVEAGPMACPTMQVCSPTTSQCVAMCPMAICPAQSHCETGSGLCVANAGDASTDQTETASDARPGDSSGSTGDGGPCRSLGCKCSGNADCDSYLCVDEVAATADLYAAAGSSSFCAETCCTSEDCQAGAVCFATAAGANYCVNPAWLGDRTTPGSSGQGGASCGEGSACRSGLCVGGLCADTCCSTESTTQCASGTVCAFADFPGPPTGFDTNLSANCAPLPAGGSDAAGGQPCSFDSDCASNLCLSDGCSDACRNSADCPSGESCWYLLPYLPDGGESNATVAACYPSVEPNVGIGQSCASGGPMSCANNLCVGTTCTDTCFVDSDCPEELPQCVLTLLQVGMGGKVYATVCGP
jgi:hypothetical protein